MKERGFEVLDHPADMGLKIWAPSLDSLFAEAALALTESLFDLNSISQEMNIDIQVSASEKELLLYQWLSEVLFLFDADGLIFNRFEILDLFEEGVNWKLSARGLGEEYDPLKHQVKTYVKAVTMHQLKIEKDSLDNLFKAYVYLDI